MVFRPAATPFLRRVWEHNDFGKGKSDQRSINHVMDHVLDRIYKYPPRSCGRYRSPTRCRTRGRSSDDDAVVRHYAGQFPCADNAYRQMNTSIANDARSALGGREDAVLDHRTLILSFVAL